MKRHPLHPLADLRDRQAENAAKLLADAREASTRAAQVFVAAEQACADVQTANTEQQQRCRHELNAGQLRAGDLQQAADWSVGAEQRQVVAEQRAEEADASLARAKASVEDARVAAARAKADADVVEELLQKARLAAAAQEVARLEEAAEDTFLARRSLGNNSGKNSGEKS